MVLGLVNGAQVYFVILTKIAVLIRVLPLSHAQTTAVKKGNGRVIN